MKSHHAQRVEYYSFWFVDFLLLPTHKIDVIVLKHLLQRTRLYTYEVKKKDNLIYLLKKFITLKTYAIPFQQTF